MATIIPKVDIGLFGKKNKFDLSCMTHTTSEIGYVQPTFSKVLVPNTRLDISTRTGSRLSPLFVPTMGELDIRHYHCFVPFNTLWFPFDAFKTATNYPLPDGDVYQPNHIPFTSVSNILYFLFGAVNSNNYTEYHKYRDYLVCKIYVSNNSYCLSDSDLTSLTSGDLDFLFNDQEILCIPGYVVSEEGHWYKVRYQGGSYHLDPQFNSFNPDLSVPSADACDFAITTAESYLPEADIPTSGSTYFTFCYNINGIWKRIRTILIGLGYSFNPYDNQNVHILKLLAFYKAYWQLFGVNRSYNFYNTWCYKIIKYTSDHVIPGQMLDNTELRAFVIRFFFDELGQCTYTCPPDYFSAADVTTNRAEAQSNGGYFFNSQSLSRPPSSNNPPTQRTFGAANNSDYGIQTKTGNVIGNLDSATSPLAQKIAARLLRFVNKNSVVGRKVSDLLRAMYGVADDHNDDHEGVYLIGAASTPIQISPIFNQDSNNTDMPLGSYAGAGSGGSVSKRFYCDTGNEIFGVFITLTAVVPKMGYFQGLLRENSDGVIDRSEIFQPEFDGLGWQAVRYNELVADRQFGTDDSYTAYLGIFGYMPSFTHLKISRNICNADISLPSMAASMLPYTLDRYFSPRGVVNQNLDIGRKNVIIGTELPVNDPMWFRAGTRGNTNRIFSSTSPTEDHVIMQIFFDISMTAPMKSISTSFDTIDEESTRVHSVEHE